MSKFSLSLETVFLFLSLTFGIIFSFIIPPFILGDEESAFLHSVSMSKHWGSEQLKNNGQVTVPNSFNKMLITKQSTETHYSKYVYYNGNWINKKFSEAETYAPVKITPYSNLAFLFIPMGGVLLSYFFSLFGLTVSTLSVLIFARIFNVLIFSILGYRFLKLMNFSKEFAFLLLLCPMVVMFSATVNSIAISTLATLFFLYVIINELVGNQKFILHNWNNSKILIFSFFLGLFLPICIAPIALIIFIRKGHYKKINLFLMSSALTSLLYFTFLVPSSHNIFSIFSNLPDFSEQFSWLLNDIFVDQDLLNFFPNPLVHFFILTLVFLFLLKTKRSLNISRNTQFFFWIISGFLLISGIYLFFKKSDIAMLVFRNYNSYMIYSTLYGILFFIFSTSKLRIFNIRQKITKSIISFLAIVLLASTLLAIIISLYY